VLLLQRLRDNNIAAKKQPSWQYQLHTAGTRLLQQLLVQRTGTLEREHSLCQETSCPLVGFTNSLQQRDRAKAEWGLVATARSQR